MEPSGSQIRRDTFSAQIIEADSQARSWREKLAWVRDLLLDEAFGAERHQLAELAVYLRFVGTGAISCEEDGGHHRPSRHAKMSEQIHDRLASLDADALATVLRRIYPWLPSFDSEFTHAEPLTRIRDIAHRNDIPQDLKSELKHTLQNKLHRCAGPEDLSTSAALLERFTASNADYPAPFVEEFQVFHEELRQFFGAWSAVELLRNMDDTDGAPHREQLLRLIQHLEKPAAERMDTLERSMAVLRDLTAMRLATAQRIPNSTGSARQRQLRLDLALEEQAFVVLSSVVGHLDGLGEGWTRWAEALEALALSTQQTALSAVDPEECAAVRAETERWGEGFDSADRDALLRLKATVERCQRICARYANAVLDLFAEPAQRLGPALGVAEHTIATYCESDLRANVVFQLSRLTSVMAAAIRERTGTTGWAPLVAGSAHGHVRVADSLEELDNNASEPIILLLRQAHGDEDPPEHVQGIVLAHEIPLLSHLGVRARQYGIPMASCLDGTSFEQLVSELAGQSAQLTVEATQATLSPATATGTEPAHSAETSPAAAPPELRHAEPVAVQLGNPSHPPAGGKSAGLARLMEAEKAGTGPFRTPETLAVPLGVMEGVLARHPALNKTYDLLVARLDGAKPEDLATLSRQLVGIVEQLDVPPAVVEAIRTTFPSPTRVMVRSSANSEDTTAAAGAGRYVSVANVPSARVARAIRRVWASLWDHSAILSRQREGLSQQHCQMGVLIQAMLDPDLSFVLHTVDPLSGQPDLLCAELSVGLGETLVSGATPGTPFRLVCSKSRGTHQMQAFSSFSTALHPRNGSGLEATTVDHSQVRFSCDSAHRATIATRLAAIGAGVERYFGRPQDIEGVIVGDDVYLVQARDQQGLSPQQQIVGSVTPPASPKRPSAQAKAHKPPKPTLPPLRLLGLYDRRFPGDDALLQLAARRFAQNGLGTELHPESPNDLERLIAAVPPPPAPRVAHLPRNIDLLTSEHRDLIGEYAHRSGGQIHGFVVHDQPEMVSTPNAYQAAVGDLDAILAQIEDAPWLFIEYAVGHDPSEFVEFFVRNSATAHISACIDTGHVGIRHARRAFSQRHQQPDVCQLSPYHPDLPGLIEDVTASLEGCLDAVLGMLVPLGALGKPLHLHLHDGHPLWTHSPFGVSDHLSFLEELPIPFEHRGQRSVALMFGEAGLARIATTALEAAAHAQTTNAQTTMTLEIHPVAGRLPLGSDEEIFSHWSDLAHAERMSYWLAMLLRNAEVLRASVEQ